MGGSVETSYRRAQVVSQWARPDVELPRTATVAVVCHTSAHFFWSLALSFLVWDGSFWSHSYPRKEKLDMGAAHPSKQVPPPIIHTIKHKTF